jgi:hypothetical protein
MDEKTQQEVPSVLMVDGTGFEPVASAMPTLRSFQANLPAHDILNPAEELLSVMGRGESQSFPHINLAFQAEKQTET